MPNALRAALVRAGHWSAERALADTAQLWSLGERAEALSVLIPVLPEAMRRDALRQAVALAREDRAAYAAGQLLPLLDPRAASELRDEALGWVEADWERAWLDPPPPDGAVFRPDLRRDLESFAEDEATDEYVPAPVRDRLLGTLRSGDLQSALERALEVAAELRAVQRSPALERLLPYLPDGALERVAEIARRLGDSAAVYASVAKLVPYLSGATIERLAAGAAQLPEVPERPIAMAMFDPGPDTLAGLLPFGRLSIDMEECRAAMWIVRHLEGRRREEAIAAALDSARAISNESYSGECIAIIACEVADAATRARLEREAVEVVRAESHPGLRALGLAHTLPWLPEAHHGPVLDEVEALITGPGRYAELKPDEHERKLDRLVLAHVAAWRSRGRDDVHALLDAVKALGRIGVLVTAYVERPAALAVVARLLPDLPAAEAYELWRRAVRSIADRPRSDVVDSVAVLMPAVPPAERGPTAEATIAVVLDAARWWP
jgi:hypothetical protein